MICDLKPRKNGQSCNVYALRASIGTADSNKLENGVVRVFRGEKFLVERRIFGVYEKFNSNSGWSAGNGLLPDFFSHWSYVHSGRKLLLCDLQGHKGRPGGPKYGSEEYYYLFTDTAVLSEGQCYGCTDLGPEGMKDWFAHHVCNDMCKKANIEGIRAAPLRYPPALPPTPTLPRRSGHNLAAEATAAEATAVSEALRLLLRVDLCTRGPTSSTASSSAVVREH